ncbi:MAG: GH32 C-terminal domain-containing protein [Planctomycetota bacterium]|nr:GH32 C-terminal domain-containing protein [Planctomycetota bacterium]
MSKLHYRPADGYFGDPVPFFWKGTWHVIYLKGQLDEWRRVRYTPYHHLVSRDLVNWEELPVALPIGGVEDIDMSLGRFYLLYCGRVFAGDRSTGSRWEGAQKEVTCLATSDDLVHWTKRGNPVLVPENSPYTVSDFRDPYPFWNEEDGQYWMVVATQTKDPAVPFRGALTLAKSKDLVRWEFAPKPFWAPNTTGYRVSLERWPRAWELLFLNERALSVRPGAPVKLQLFVDGDIVEAFVDDQVAMCARIYDYRAGDIGLFASHASVSFDELRIRTLP